MLINMLKILLQWHLILLLICNAHTTNAANERLLKINTDLTAGVIDAGAGANVGAGAAAGASASVVNSGSVDTIKQNTQQNIVINTQKLINLTGNALETHICTREETYVEQLKVPSMQPVRVRSSNWCLEFPPRCSEYKTEMREVIKVENITKTRTIRFCCAGYEGNISSINDTICKPVCRGGCGRGFCQTPDVCSCEAGYTGTHCTQRCDHDHWGLECKNECQCQNGAVCDNKSGICHCTTGWTGDFCELPCPPGTYGVMCHKSCDCVNKRCHPQSGSCEQPQDVTPNVIETLNSTIANITHNLNQIAKKIVNIVTTTEATILVSEVHTPKATLPEVIVIKQDEQHTPKIILHQQSAAGLLEDLHTAGAKTPEVIHVITGWPGGSHHNATLLAAEPKLELAGFGGGIGGGSNSTPAPANTAADHDANLLTVLLIILLIIIVAISMSFLYVYRRYHWQRERVEAVIAARNGSASSVADGFGGGVVGGAVTATNTSGAGIAAMDVTLSEAGGKNYLKPLPDLPAFTQMVRNKIEGPVYYDSPSNNSSIHNANSSITSSTYDYARKHSLYSIVSPKSRKGSPDSHLYDEIRYPSAFQHHQHGQHLQHSSYMPHHHQHQQQHQHQSQHHLPSQHQQHHQPHHQSQLHHAQSAASPQQHHITHLVIPPQNANFLQVPPMSHTSVRKVAHL